MNSGNAGSKEVGGWVKGSGSVTVASHEQIVMVFERKGKILTLTPLL